MGSSKKRDTEMLEASVTDEVLEDTPERVVTFLRAVGTSRAIRRAMMTRGYSPEDHKEGWQLLGATTGFVGASDDFEAEDIDVADAIRELDAADETVIRIVRATLRRHYPDQAARVLQKLAPATGAAAVVSMKTLLDRLDEIEKTGDRQNQGAIALLARRGLHADERDRLRSLVKKAQSAKPVDAVSDDDVAAEREYRNALVRLRSWYEEWSDIARATVRRRDYLIRLGLASRKSPERPGASQDPAPTPTDAE